MRIAEVVLVALLATALLGGRAASAQAPVSGMHTSMGPGAGLTSAVSPAGGYATSVPLDLPAPRGPVPVPVSVVHNGSPRAGVAGVGWDVPLSYVHVSTTPWRRKPVVGLGGNDSAPAQVTVVLDGAATLMVLVGDHYVPFAGGQYQELRETGGGWTLTTVDDLEYHFGLVGPDVWFLTQIRDRAGRDEVLLQYRSDRAVSANVHCDGDLRLSSVSYTFSDPAIGKVPLYEIDLDYDAWWLPPYPTGVSGGVECGWRPAVTGGVEYAHPFEHVQEDGLAFDRTSLLTGIRVMARDNLAPASAPRRIRAYQFGYQPDPATDQPRLTTVTTTGEDGTPEGDPSHALPVATYGYGATAAPAGAGDEGPKLLYGAPVEIARFFIPGANYSPGLTTTVPDTAPVTTTIQFNGVPIPYPIGGRTRTRVRHLLRDFTGDGLPDLLFKVVDPDDPDAGTWYLFANRPGPNGPDLSILTTSWTGNAGPAELQMSTTVQFSGGVVALTPAQRDAMITTETWTQFADWNGDGRLDVIDADGGIGRNHWRVWLNEPSATGGLSWRAIQVDIATTRHWLENEHGYVQLADMLSPGDWSSHLPIERSRTWHNYMSGDAVRYEWTAYNGWSPLPHQPEDTWERTFSTNTYTEWQLADHNGDGFLDFVASSAPVRRCATLLENQCLQSDDTHKVCGSYRSDTALSSTNCNEVDYAAHGHLAYALNQLGPFTPLGPLEPSPFGEPRQIDDDSVWGIGQWAAGSFQLDGHTTWHTTDLTQAETDGHAWSPNPEAAGVTWQVQGLGDKKQTGTLALEQGDAGRGAVRFENEHKARCEDFPRSADYLTIQTGGMADLDGDGRADLLYPGGDWHPGGTERWPTYWWVRFATGAGFGPRRRLDAPWNQRFALSESSAQCDPYNSEQVNTTAGLTDMDGDGRPELLRVSAEGRLFMSKLTTAEGELGLAAGRLRTIDNGRGATTTITYANRKQLAPHNGDIPQPEVVVASVGTVVSDGSAPNSAPTYYGYGGPAIAYDPLAGRWEFQGYRRQVTASGTPNPWQPGAIDGVLTFVDRAPPAAPGSTYTQHVLGGQQSSTKQLQRFGIQASQLPFYSMDGDYWNYFAGTTPTYGVVALKPAGAVVGDARYDCGDLDPATGDVVGTGRCGAAGLVYVAGSESWEGHAAPPATSNVQTGSTIEAVDPQGRPVRIHDRGDLRLLDDDLCTQVWYAATPDGRPFPSVPSRVSVDDCGLGSPALSPGSIVTLASTAYRYDGLPEGQVATGLLTSRSVDRYGPAGYLDTIDAEHFEYGIFAQVSVGRSQRVLGSPATRETAVSYDAFGATVTASTVTATDVPPRSTTAKISTWPSHPSVVTDPTGVTSTTERDGYGRAVKNLVRPMDGADTTLRRTTFHDDLLHRRVDVDVFPVGAAPGSEDAAPDRQSVTTAFDALGRPRYHRRILGSDYAGVMLVSGLVEYDALGRVAFEAQPFEVQPLENLDMFDPSLMTEVPYGTTTIYDPRGRVSRTVAARGRQEQTWTSSAATSTFVTSWSYKYDLGQALTTVTGPEGNDPAAGDHAWVHTVRSATATGREIQTATLDGSGQVLDRIASEQDRLGRVVLIRRFGELGTPPVLWQASYDSLDRRLTISEPGMGLKTSSYDEDGNELETSWQDGGMRRVTRQRYDALGRLTERVLAHEPTAGGQVVEATDRFHYDAPFGTHPVGMGSYLGRLAAATTDGVGGEYYAYDPLGRTETTTYDYAGQPLASEGAAYTVGGRLTDLKLKLAGTTDVVSYGYDSAARVRQVRDGAGPTVYFAATTVTPDGDYANVVYGNGVSEQFLHQPEGRRQVFEWSATTASGSYKFNNWFDTAGRVQHERQQQPSSVAKLEYDYDGLGQLRQSLQVGGANDGLEWFAHDPLGNLTMRLATTAAGSREYTPDVADGDRLCRYAPIGSPGPCQFTYDAAGNVVADSTAGDGVMELRKFTYDSGQRLTSIHRGATTADLTYGPLGKVATTVTGPTPRQVWSFGSLIEKRIRADGAVQLERRIPGPLGIVASLRHDGTSDAIVYTHGDGRGNRFFTDGTGHVVQEATYAPYGRITSESGAGLPLTHTDELWNGGDDLREIGVVLLGPRAYDPEIGRFLQRDPIIHTGSSSTGNPYSFAFGDPVNYSDPSGLEPWITWNGGASHLSPFSPAGILALGGIELGIFAHRIGAPSAPQAPVAVPVDPAGFAAAWANQVGVRCCSAGNSSWTAIPRLVAEETYHMAGGMLSDAVDGGACVLSGNLRACTGVYHRAKGTAQLAAALWHDPSGTLRAMACPDGDCVRGGVRFGLQALVAVVAGRVDATGLARGAVRASSAATAAGGGGERLALGISEHLDAFAAKQGATTWKSFPDPLRWKPTMVEKLADPNVKILFNLEGVELWPGVSRAARGAGGATDWELLQIQQNPQWWNSIEWWKGGAQVPNPLQ